MTAFVRAIGTILGSALIAVLLTTLTGAVWAGLLLYNLKFHPELPWAAGAMAAISAALWLWLVRGSPSARAKALPPRIFLYALAASGAGIIALAGLWTVLVVLVRVPGHLVDVSHVRMSTVIASYVMAGVVGGVFEEVGFRGYFQGTLERYVPAWAAVAICAAAMAPLHSATQGFVWPVIVFYLLIDFVLGASAAITKSILPGIVAHVIGLFCFFWIIWPADAHRPPFGAPDPWFWIHVAQAAIFGLASIVLFGRLNRTAA